MTAEQMRAAWDWVIALLPERPAAGPICVFDDLAAWADQTSRLLHCAPPVIEQVTNLYLTSSFADHGELLRFVNGANSFDVAFLTPTLDPAVKRIYKSAPRLRASLAEHLGFWIPLASARKRSANAHLAGSPPHTLPEDTGPDSLIMELQPLQRLEIVSVKNSAGDPRRMVASEKFKARGMATKGCLDEFDHLIKKNEGFTKVFKLVANTCSHAGAQLQPQLKAAMVASADYHAFVVASQRHSDMSVFDGFVRVSDGPSRRIATFVGSDDWSSLAAKVRREVKLRLEQIEAW